MIYFTADTHFGHANIIRFCGRPFTTAREMDERLIQSINSRVGPTDTLYHLGDFSFGSGAMATVYRRRLHCRKIYLVPGNHDKRVLRAPGQFEVLPPLAEISAGDDNNLRIVLCHYALRTWPGKNRGSWHLYGHSHGALPEDPNLPSCDVGVDVHQFNPVSLEELQERFKGRRGWGKNEAAA